MKEPPMSDKKDGLEEAIKSCHEYRYCIGADNHTEDFYSVQKIASAIRLWIEQNLPEEKQGIKFHGAREDKYSPTDHEKVGFNSCLAQVKKNLLED